MFDEIHQLKDPTRILKIGADHFPNPNIFATGSSTLATSSKFRDTLTGRKRTVKIEILYGGKREEIGQSTVYRIRMDQVDGRCSMSSTATPVTWGTFMSRCSMM